MLVSIEATAGPALGIGPVLDIPNLYYGFWLKGHPYANPWSPAIDMKLAFIALVHSNGAHGNFSINK